MLANEKRLIDANALLEKIQYRLPFKDMVAEMINEIVEITRKQIVDAPTVDAVEVVRCRECENAVSFSWSAAGEKVHGFRCMKDEGAIGYKCVVSGDDFCASGKRRTNNA